MDLLDLIDILDGSSVLKRKTIDTRKGVTMTQYKAESDGLSVTINEDTHNNLIQICLKHDDTNIYLYANNTLRRNYTQNNISTIEDITIQWQMKIPAMVVATENGTMETNPNAITYLTIVA